MVGIWWAHGGYMVGPWWVYGGPMVGIWWAHGGYMVGPWWVYGGPMVGIWWAHGGCMVARGGYIGISCVFYIVLFLGRYVPLPLRIFMFPLQSGGSRVLAHNPLAGMLVASKPSSNQLLPGYGVLKVST